MTEPAAGASRLQTRWILQAVLAALAAMLVGLLLLAIPGALVLEIVEALGLARELEPDSVWPLAIVITLAGSVMIAPVSLAWRHKRPDIVGWGHVWRTAVVTIAGTVLLTLLLAS